MWFVAGTFIGVLAIVLGAYWLFITREEERVIERLKPRRSTQIGLVRSVVKSDEEVGSMAALQGALERTPAVDGLRMMVAQSGLSLNVATLVLLMGFAGLGGYAAGVWLTGRPLAGFGAGFLAMWFPYWYVSRARTKRLHAFEETFPEAIDLVARALRAGHALPTGLGMVADEMPEPIGPEFRVLHDEQNYGLTLADALRNFARRIPSIDARFFVTAVLTQRESGGNLSEVLDNLSSVIRARFKVKRQIRVISAHGRITGWVLTLLPPSLAAVTMVLNPDHLGTLTGDPLGQQMIAVAVVLQIVGTLAIRKIINIEY